MALNPMTQTEQQAGVSDYAMPYVESMLGATQKQLFNYDPQGNITSMKGYTPYSYNPADYYAGFTPLQQQAQQGVAGLSLPSTFGQSIGLTGQTYGGLMGLGQQASQAGQNYAMQATNPYAVSAYMNPYLMNSLAPQMQLLQQQQAQQGQQLASQASKAGAFGGSRYGIQQGLQDQANQLAMSNLVGQGYNNAFNQALQNMQYGANLGLQGQQAAAGMYGQGLGAANQLSNIGNQALQAQQGILGLQQQTGATQQGLQQQMIDRAVQNYNTAQQYPYQQLGFMQNMLQGLPISTTSQQTYQQAPSMMQNLAALGMGMYGLNSLLGGGSGSGTGGGLTGALNTIGGSIGTGLTNAYNWAKNLGNPTTDLSSIQPTSFVNDAGGLEVAGSLGFAEGGSVESPGNIEAIVDKLSDQQLQQALQMAMARNDVEQARAVREEMATRASERGGLAGAFNMLPQQARMQLAGGGVVAFTKGGWSQSDSGMYVADSDTEGEDEAQDRARTEESPGNPVSYAQLGPLAVAEVKRLRDMPDFQAATAEQRAAMQKEYIAQAKANAGESPYAGLQKYLADAETDRGAALEQGKGLAALAAMKGMLQPGGFMRGLGSAGSEFAGQYGQALAADRAEKRNLAQMKFNLADAERKERMGLHREAQEAVAKAEQNRLDAHKAAITKQTNAVNALARTAQAMKPTAARTGAGAQPKPELVHLENIKGELREKHKYWTPAQINAEASRQVLGMSKVGSAGTVTRSFADAEKAFENARFTPGWRKYVKEQYGGDETAATRDFMRQYQQDALPAYLQGLTMPPTKPSKPADNKAPALPPGAVLDQ